MLDVIELRPVRTGGRLSRFVRPLPLDMSASSIELTYRGILAPPASGDLYFLAVFVVRRVGRGECRRVRTAPFARGNTQQEQTIERKDFQSPLRLGQLSCRVA
jgi:hypothetical protein